MNLSLPPSRTREVIVRCLRAGLVPYIKSSPGVGKSDITKGVGKEYRLKLIDFRLSQCDVTDLSGLPHFLEDGRAEFAPFTTFPLEGDPIPENYDGWLLFFDELSSAPKQLQAASYKVILDRMVGQRKLHPKVMIVCAGNLRTDMAVTHDMSTALQSRLVHAEMHCDHREWMEWAIREGNIDSRILGFLEFRPQLLHKFDPQHTDNTFACPRTWEFVSRLIHGQKDLAGDLALLAGTVGAGAAQEFVTFAQIFQDLPKISEIIKDPDNAAVPSEPSTKYAMSTYIADHVTTQNVEALMKYLRRLPVECQVLCMRMVNLRASSLIGEKAIQELFRELIRLM